MAQENNDPSFSEPQSTLLEEELLANGRRYLVCSNFQLATQAFQEACQIMSDKYGELASELAVPYYLYGKSLLELARQESNVLGGGVPAPPEDEEDSSEEEEEEEKEEVTQPTDEAPPTNEAPPTEENQSNEGILPVDEATPTNEATNEDQPTDEAPPTEGEDKDVGTLQLAWEMLEVTRLICQKELTKEKQLLLADVCMLLGEVGLESDLYDQAIDDFTTCLQVREAILSPDDRKLAEGHFNLGLTHSLAKRHKEAISEYESTKQILELRKEKLECDLEKNSVENRQKLIEEVDDISSLLPEIESKISEEFSLINDSSKLQEEEEEEEEEDNFPTSLVSSSTSITQSTGQSASPFIKSSSSNVGSTTSSNGTAVQVSDISHLVRRKPTTTTAQPSTVTTNGDLLTDNEAIPAKRKRSIDVESSQSIPVKKKPAAATVEAQADSTTIT